jgi:head-tail adaptor
MATPRAQELNQQISFMNTTAPVTADGVATETTIYSTMWARITENGGSMEAVEQQHQIQRQGFEVWCRYDSGITGFMQISWGTRTLRITTAPQKVADQNGRFWTLIQAEEITGRDL